MKQPKPSLDMVINLTVTIIMVYLLSVLVLPSAALAFGLCGLSLLATGWVALRILRDPYSTDKSFEDQFYQDRDDIRRVKN